MVPITKRQELPYSGRVEVVYTTDVFEAEKWLRAHIIDCSAAAVGFDIEWKPQFVSKKDGGVENETAVLQLAVETSCLVLHIYHMSKLPKSLASILVDKNIRKVGSGIKQDCLKLGRDRGLVVKGLADIQLMAKEMSPALQKTGLKALADRFLGIELDKSGALSNWERFPLTSRQIEYAASDAWVGLKIFQEMKRQMRLKDREFEGSITYALSPPEYFQQNGGESLNIYTHGQETKKKIKREANDKPTLSDVIFLIILAIICFLFAGPLLNLSSKHAQ